MDPIIKFILGLLSVAPWIALLAWYGPRDYAGPFGRLWMRKVWLRMDDFSKKRICLGVYGGVAGGMLAAWLLTLLAPFLFQTDSLLVQSDDPLGWTLQIAFLRAGLIEELVKCLIGLFLALGISFAWKNSALSAVLSDRPFSASTPFLCASTGLGFALIENMEYVPTLLQIQGILSVFFSRTIAALAHLLFGLNFGLFLYTARRSNWPVRVWTGILVSVLLHGVFDFFALPQGLFSSLLSHIFVVLMAFFLLRRLWSLKDEFSTR